MKKLILIIVLFQLFTCVFAQGQIAITPEQADMFNLPVGKEFVLTDGYRNGFPPIWEPPTGGASASMGIIVYQSASPRVNQTPLNTGDYIGGFYTDQNGILKCGGAMPWPSNLGVLISLVGDKPETPQKDGFAYGEKIYFKFFSYSRMKEYDVDVLTFDPNQGGDDHWYPIAFSYVLNIQALVDFDFYIQASGNPLCLGNQLTLQAKMFKGTTGNYSYQWSSTPPGFNYTAPNPPPVSPTVNTTYHLTVTDGVNVSEHQQTIIVNQQPEVSAGQGGTICQGQNFTASGTGANYSSIAWSTSGSGTFYNPGAFTTTYYPTAADIASGGVTLTLSGFPLAPCQQIATSSVILVIQKYPTANAGSDKHICVSEISYASLQGSATSYGALQWTTAGDGTFSNSNILAPKYYPGIIDQTAGSAVLTLLATAAAPCQGSANDQVMVTMQKGATVSAPGSRTRCENVPVPLAGNATNYTSVYWTTAGDGTFSDPTIFNGDYYAGTQDKANGGTTVTLHVLPVAPCTAPVAKDVSIILKPLPNVITFGPSTSFLCPGNSYLQLNAQVSNGGSTLWSTSGDGTFTSLAQLSTRYYPGGQDYQNGIFTLTLTVAPISPCVTPVATPLLVTIASAPVINILNANNSASCGSVQLQATTSSVQALLWTTGGDGTFSNSTIANPVYLPGTNDLNNSGATTLTLTGTSPCTQYGSVQDVVAIFFEQNATANAGNDAAICQNTNYPLATSAAAHYQTLLWSTSGTGTFSNAAVLHPVYTPGTADINAGQVTLTLTATSKTPCTLTATDQMVLTINKMPQANAGADATICQTANHPLTGVTANNYASLLWQTSGNGTFSNSQVKNPIYYPGTTDITTGSVNLTLKLTGAGACSMMVTDAKTLTIRRTPNVNAGADKTVCGAVSMAATANNYAQLQWSTSGDGTFSNRGTLNPVYYPGTADLQQLQATLTLSALPQSPCTQSVSDQLLVTFNIPTILNDQVTDKTLYTGQSLLLSFSVANPALGSFAWYHNGQQIPNQGGSQLSVTSVTPDDAGTYQSIFTNNCGQIASQVAQVQILKPVNQLVMLPAGWSGISTFIEPNNPALPVMFAPILSKLIILSDNQGIYWPPQQVNTIGTWDNATGYSIKTTQATTLLVSGVERFPKAAVVIPVGWSYLPVNAGCQVSVTSLFGAKPQIAMIKEMAGNNMYWPAFGINTIINLIPGKAYQIYNAGAPLNITFPVCE
ncbi:MAG: hypothetical protein EOM83_05255 [Clostridia bacterium]|nr:hypothetical protein [Clostridia bacterium]